MHVEHGRVDSRERYVRFLLAEMDIGFAFVRSAWRITAKDMRLRILRFAQHAHDTIVRSIGEAPLTGAEHDRLRRGLYELQLAISNCAGDTAAPER
jgi:hypothetical protein